MTGSAGPVEHWLSGRTVRDQMRSSCVGARVRNLATVPQSRTERGLTSGSHQPSPSSLPRLPGLACSGPPDPQLGSPLRAPSGTQDHTPLSGRPLPVSQPSALRPKVTTPGLSPDPQTGGPLLPGAVEGTRIASSPLGRSDSIPPAVPGAARSRVAPTVHWEAWACVRVRPRPAPERPAGRAPDLQQYPRGTRRYGSHCREEETKA